jgi:hypothetical protein
MSRSGYVDDDYGANDIHYIQWRSAVSRSMRGKRGQKMLRDLLEALDDLPSKQLSANSLVTEDGGSFCALGALGHARGLEMLSSDPEDIESIADMFGISKSLAAEIMYMNDEWLSESKYVEVEIFGPVRPYYPEYGRHRRLMSVPNENVCSDRWWHMRDWVAQQIAD